MATRLPGNPPEEDPTRAATRLPESDPRHAPFVPEVLDKTVIAIPLLRKMKARERITELEAKKRRTAAEKAEHEALLKEHPQPEPFPVVIDVNMEYPGGRDRAREEARKLIDEVAGTAPAGAPAEGLNTVKSDVSQQYLFARLSARAIRELVQRDREASRGEQRKRAIYKIWPDFPVQALTYKSLRTVKADAARASFAALGKGMVWAVVDSGIQGDHPHFQTFDNLNLEKELGPDSHRDFTDGPATQPLVDEYGHGTHVAGIIAGQLDGKEKIRAFGRVRDERGEVTYDPVEIDSISGMAPQCKLLSLKVLNQKGDGLASNLIVALEYVQQLNSYGRRIRVHGVNMSVGYDFEPEWFACGQSPLCVEVDRLVRTGVVVVVAAGNTGYGWSQSAFRGTVAAGMDLTINDPGNADLAITVGSTHRDMPHVYGVSYFSSKGPTGDGRNKPDLVAPGEKILSCAAGERRTQAKDKTGTDCTYVEDSGTSMAAPHVSGVIAAFLSIRQEFVGDAERVKEIFLSTATDLRREKYFQGYGLVDLMRAIQSV